jgi:hypothetical protein
LATHPHYRKDNPMGTLHNPAPPGPDAAAELTALAELRAWADATEARLRAVCDIAAAAFEAEGLPVPPELGVLRPGDWGWKQRRPRGHLQLVTAAAAAETGGAR